MYAYILMAQHLNCSPSPPIAIKSGYSNQCLNNDKVYSSIISAAAHDILILVKAELTMACGLEAWNGA